MCVCVCPAVTYTRLIIDMNILAANCVINIPLAPSVIVTSPQVTRNWQWTLMQWKWMHTTPRWIGKSGFFESSYATIKGLASTGGLLMALLTARKHVMKPIWLFANTYLRCGEYGEAFSRFRCRSKLGPILWPDKTYYWGGLGHFRLTVQSAVFIVIESFLLWTRFNRWWCHHAQSERGPVFRYSC